MEDELLLHLHKILLPLGRLGLAAGVKLLVEEIDDSHVVLDVEVVEERLPDLKRRDQLYECSFADVSPSLFKNQISVSILPKFPLEGGPVGLGSTTREAEGDIY